MVLAVVAVVAVETGADADAREPVVVVEALAPLGAVVTTGATVDDVAAGAEVEVAEASGAAAPVVVVAPAAPGAPVANSPPRRKEGGSRWVS